MSDFVKNKIAHDLDATIKNNQVINVLGAEEQGIMHQTVLLTLMYLVNIFEKYLFQFLVLNHK